MHGLSDGIGLVETKVRSGKAARITRCLGKDCNKAITVENEAGNGRIWLIDLEYNYDINEIQRSDQAFYFSCWDKKIKKNTHFFLPFGRDKKASNLISERRCLWEQLKEVSKRIQGPWLVIGDFNNSSNKNKKEVLKRKTWWKTIIWEGSVYNCIEIFALEDLKATGHFGHGATSLKILGEQ